MRDKKLTKLLLEVICDLEIRHVANHVMDKEAGIPPPGHSFLGYYDGGKILLNDEVKGRERLKVALHEIAHHYRSSYVEKAFKNEKEREKDADFLAEQWFRSVYGNR